MWLLFAACTPPPPPSLSLPPLPAAQSAEPVGIDRFLAATELGAKDALLCPWFRGESVPDASLARWTAEQRLVWLAVEVRADGARLAGDAEVGARARAAKAAATTLAERCGVRRPVEALLLVAPDATARALGPAVSALGGAGLDGAWLAVDDATPEPRTPGAGEGVARVRLEDGRRGLVGRDGAAWPPAGASASPPSALALSAFVAAERPACVYVATVGDADVADALALIDELRSAGAPHTALVAHPAAAASPAAGVAPGGAAAGVAPAAGSSVPLHGTLAALPLGLDVPGAPCAGAPSARTYPPGPAAL